MRIAALLEAESPESFPAPGPHCAASDRNGSLNMDYEGENSCCSTQLSLDISDVFSGDSKTTTRTSIKPPIPTIICSSSSLNRFIITAKLNARQNKQYLMTKCIL